MNQMAQWLLLVGFILIVVEMFIPGFGIFGISGIISIIVSIVLLSPNMYYATIFILCFIVFITIVFVFIVKNISNLKFGTKLFLGTKLKEEDGFLSSKENNSFIGQDMITDTVLRPSGKVIKDGVIYDAMSNGELIEKDEKVTVIGNKGYILIVQRRK